MLVFKYFFVLQKYHEYNVDVVRKDGLILVRELATEVKNHMDFKISAVMVSEYLYYLEHCIAGKEVDIW